MTSLSPKKIAELCEAIADKVGFTDYMLDVKRVSDDLKKRLKALPKIRTEVRVTGRGFKGMWEPGVVVGYMGDPDNLKALVMYLERNEEDGPAYDFVEATKVRPAKAAPPPKDILNYKRSR